MQDDRISQNPKDKVGRSKPPMNLLPAVARIQAALAMRNGAEKYGAYNWRSQPVGTMLYLDAADRHMAAYLDGERAAPDSGVHHIAHAIASLSIILDAEEQGTLIDDRPTKGGAGRLLEEYASPDILELIETRRRNMDPKSIIPTPTGLATVPDHLQIEVYGASQDWSPQDKHLVGRDVSMIDHYETAEDNTVITLSRQEMRDLMWRLQVGNSVLIFTLPEDF